MSVTLLAADGTPVPPPAKSGYGPFVIAGLVIVVILFGGAGAWASFAMLSSAVIAPGVVAVDSNWRTIQHLEGGIVREILVRDGDRVEIGDLLLSLDATRAEASHAIIVGQLDVARATEARLLAERDNASYVNFPDELVSRVTPEILEITAGQDSLFWARRESLDGQVDIILQRIEQLRDQIVGLGVQQAARNRQVVLIEEELVGLYQLYEDGYATRPRILALEREAERLRGERGEDLAEIARAEEAIGQAELEILQLEKGFREEVITELERTQATIYDLEQRLVATQDELTRIDITAPTSGTVVGMNAHTVGGVISPGNPILSIVPENDFLIVRVRVRPDDIEDVGTGQLAEVRMTGLSQRTTPTLFGDVVSVSPDRLVDEVTGEPYYDARISIPPDEIDRLNDVELIPGMPAEAMILTGERTALSYLIEPLTSGLNRAFKQ